MNSMFVRSSIARSEGDPKVVRSGRSSRNMTDRMARGIGWSSIGLGMAELIAANQLARIFGMQGSESLIRAFGAREIIHGVLTLSPEKQLGLWSRIIGDGLDIAVLVKAMGSHNRKRKNVGIALALVIGVAAIDIIGAGGVTRRHSRGVGKPRSYKDRSGFPNGLLLAQRRVRNLKAPTNIHSAAVTALRRRTLDRRAQIH
jgi:hypothetical protein